MYKTEKFKIGAPEKLLAHRLYGISRAAFEQSAPFSLALTGFSAFG
jgi:hypothetical protein